MQDELQELLWWMHQTCTDRMILRSINDSVAGTAQINAIYGHDGSGVLYKIDFVSSNTHVDFKHYQIGVPGNWLAGLDRLVHTWEEEGLRDWLRPLDIVAVERNGKGIRQLPACSLPFLMKYAELQGMLKAGSITGSGLPIPQQRLRALISQVVDRTENALDLLNRSRNNL